MVGKLTNSMMVYRIVHFDNMDFILKNGLFAAGNKDADPNYKSIGNSEIINTRATFKVKISGFGFLNDYVPFYFGRQSIMLYNVLTGHGGVRKCTPAEIIYLCCKITDLTRDCPAYFFTDGQANKKFTEHFSNLDDLGRVDWLVVNGSDFKTSEEDVDRPRKYQAEFLVHQHVPVSCISSLVVYDRNVKSKIELLLSKHGLSLPVEIAKRNEYYFYF